jgi:hypothetical protein
MPEINDLSELEMPDLPHEDEMKPWEQRIGPGMGSGGPPPPAEQIEKLERACQEMDGGDLAQVIDQQTDLVHLPMVNRHTTPDTDLSLKPESNAEVWQQFISEQLYDTRRVTLEHFHLFEWFPLTPGKFHTPKAQDHRRMAYQSLERADGQVYFNPLGKANMIEGGIGAVRLRPRQIAGEPHYFMTASSSGVCHEGFPVLIPRRFYGPLKARILGEGAVPVTLGGEMRYIPNDTLTFFGRNREIPLLYLHVDELSVLPRPRSEVTKYYISVAVSFVGRFQEREGRYATYANFDPARPDSLERACEWLEQFYVAGEYRGDIITDFDELRPRFPQAVFGLPTLMAGRLDPDQVRDFLRGQGLDEQFNQPFFLIYREINTQGGAYIEGDVHTGGGDFIGRGRAN